MRGALLWTRRGYLVEAHVLEGRPVSELAAAHGVLAERREMAILAARIDPPAYVRNELGERPRDPAKQKTWDRGVARIERYRHEQGSKTRTNHSAGSQRPGPSAPANRRRCGVYGRHRKRLASASTRRGLAASAEG